MKFPVAGVLLQLAVAAPQLLNGQVFTNSLVGIVLACGSVIVAIVANRRYPVESRKRFWCLLTGSVALLIAVVLCIKLPTAYAFQKNFNRQIDEIRQRQERAQPNVDAAASQSDARGVNDATN